MGFDVRSAFRFRPSELHAPIVYTERIGARPGFNCGLTFKPSGAEGVRLGRPVKANSQRRWHAHTRWQ